MQFQVDRLCACFHEEIRVESEQSVHLSRLPDTRFVQSRTPEYAIAVTLSKLCIQAFIQVSLRTQNPIHSLSENWILLALAVNK